MKKLIAVALALLTLVSLAACGRGSRMPFNGDITFHELTMTVPDSFIRDSTQSDDNGWVFEKGGYKQMIIVTRSERTQDADTTLQSYAESMTEVGATTEITEYLGCKGVRSAYTRNEMFCQEMLFIHGTSIYAIALRGGTEAEFDDLLGTVKLAAPVGETGAAV